MPTYLPQPPSGRNKCGEASRGNGRLPLIGARGFEPPTSPTRTVRATRLRHAPKWTSVWQDFAARLLAAGQRRVEANREASDQSLQRYRLINLLPLRPA